MPYKYSLSLVFSLEEVYKIKDLAVFSLIGITWNAFVYRYVWHPSVYRYVWYPSVNLTAGPWTWSCSTMEGCMLRLPISPVIKVTPWPRSRTFPSVKYCHSNSIFRLWMFIFHARVVRFLNTLPRFLIICCSFFNWKLYFSVCTNKDDLVEEIRYLMYLRKYIHLVLTCI